jgi:methionyl-tRNA formyltransferase
VRVVYFGTPASAVPPLHALVGDGHDVAFVVTQPDRRRSRGTGTDPSPVKQAATALGLPVRTPEKAREVVADVRDSGAELGVVVAFGQLLPPALLDAVPFGFCNVHFSLLPRWRGAAPVERALLAGDRETGVCLMRIDAGLDTGPVYACERTPIGDDETAGELRDRLVALGTQVLLRELPRLPDATPVPQAGEPTYAEKLGVDEFRLDPARPAAELARLVRAGNPRPGAWLVAGGRRVKVWRAHVGDGGSVPAGTVDERAVLGTARGDLVLEEVQAEGKRAMAAGAWRRGVPGAPTVDAP